MGHLSIYGFCTDEAKTFKKVKTGFSDGELIQRCHTLILSNFGTKNPEVSTYLKEKKKTDFDIKVTFFILASGRRFQVRLSRCWTVGKD